MSFDFKALAERAVTVEVGGTPVHLRLPDSTVKHEVIKSTAVPKDTKPEDQSDEAVRRWNIACGKALAATVVDHDHVTAEEWSRIAIAGGTEHDEDIGKLVDAAMGLCGFKVAIDAMRKIATDPEGGVTDHTATADEQAGNSPTK